MKKEVLVLKRDNLEKSKLLNKENNNYLTDIICYLKLKNVDEYELEMMNQDIIDMFLEAQERGESAQQVLGVDYQTFCDEILQSAKYQNRRHIICEWIDIIGTILLVLVAITLVFKGTLTQNFLALFGKAEYNWILLITVGDLVSWLVLLVIAVTAYFGIMKYQVTNERGKRQRMISFIAGAGVMIVCFGLAIISRIFMNQILFELHAGVLLLICIVWLIVQRVMKMFN